MQNLLHVQEQSPRTVSLCVKPVFKNSCSGSFWRISKETSWNNVFHITGISEEYSKYSRETLVMEWRCFYVFAEKSSKIFLNISSIFECFVILFFYVFSSLILWMPFLNQWCIWIKLQSKQVTVNDYFIEPWQKQPPQVFCKKRCS